MKNPKALLAIIGTLMAAPAGAQLLIEGSPARSGESQTYEQHRDAKLQVFENRLATATESGLYAQIARDRTARPEVYRRLRHDYLETYVGNPYGIVGPHLRSNPRPEDLRSDLTLPWCWLYLMPVPCPSSRWAIQSLGGPAAIEAIRLQLDESLNSPTDPFLLADLRQMFFEDALKLARDGGLRLVVDAILKIRATQKDGDTTDERTDPLAHLIHKRRNVPRLDAAGLAETDRLIRAVKDPVRLAILLQLRKLGVLREPRAF